MKKIILTLILIFAIFSSNYIEAKQQPADNIELSTKNPKKSSSKTSSSSNKKSKSGKSNKESKGKTVKVKSYKKKDGTSVKAHTRKSPTRKK